MLKINEELRKYELKPYRYSKKKNVYIVDTERGSYVLKKNSHNQIYRYLKSRNFNYYPEIMSDNDDEYVITKYIDDMNLSKEQKAVDMIDLVSLLHNKTTHYKEVDEADYKKIYEDIKNNIDYLYSYYNDIMTLIESMVYMSPSEYLLARNISKVYESLNYCKVEIESWYKIVKDKKKERLVILHNNLSLDHFIRSDIPYLISWDKSKIDMPIFDLYKLYCNNSLDLPFSELLKRYEHDYPLLEEERILLFILIALPPKIEFDKSEYENCKEISRVIETLYKSELIISPYYSKQAKHNE